MLFYRLLGRLPLAVLYRLAWLGYLLLYYVAGYRQAVVRDNLRAAVPEKSAGEITALAKRFYRQLADTGVEIIRAGAMRINENGRLNLTSVTDQLEWFKSEGLVPETATVETLVDAQFVETF